MPHAWTPRAAACSRSQQGRLSRSNCEAGREAVDRGGPETLGGRACAPVSMAWEEECDEVYGFTQICVELA